MAKPAVVVTKTKTRGTLFACACATWGGRDAENAQRVEKLLGHGTKTRGGGNLAAWQVRGNEVGWILGFYIWEKTRRGVLIIDARVSGVFWPFLSGLSLSWFCSGLFLTHSHDRIRMQTRNKNHSSSPPRNPSCICQEWHVGR